MKLVNWKGRCAMASPDVELIEGTRHQMPRVLRMPALVFFGLAYMVPLALWTTYGIVTTSTSGHLPAAYVVTTLAMLLTAYSYGRMVVAYPVAGSAYAYTRGAFGGKVGFLSGWVLMLDYMLLPMICYLAIGLYMHDYAPVVPFSVWVLGAVAAATVLNILGIKLVSRVNLTIVSAQFIFIGVFISLSVAQLLGAPEVPSLTASFVSADLDFQALMGGAAILALAFIGFDAVSTLSEETIDPQVRIPRAILLCAGVAGAFYILQSYLGHLVFPDFARFESVDLATVDVMKSVGGDFLNTFFISAYVAGCFACALAGQASVSRILFAMGRDGVLPKRVFGQIHPRYGTPVGSILVVGLTGVSALFVSLTTASSLISFGALAAFSLVNLSVVKHYVIDRKHRSPSDLLKYLAVPLLGVAFTLYLWTSLSGNTFVIGLAWLAIGVAYLLVLTRGLTKEPPAMHMEEMDTNLSIQSDLPDDASDRDGSAEGPLVTR